MTGKEPGWLIHGQFYPHVGSNALTHGDLALIRDVTGLTMDQFDEGEPFLSMTGWMAVAFWHENPELRREQVVRFIERLPRDASEEVNWTKVPDGDDGPPAVAPEASSDDSSTTSGGTQEDATSSATASSEEPAPQS